MQAKGFFVGYTNLWYMMFISGCWDFGIRFLGSGALDLEFGVRSLGLAFRDLDLRFGV